MVSSSASAGDPSPAAGWAAWSALYSTDGSLGRYTPFISIVLKLLGFLAALEVAKGVKFIMLDWALSETYDLVKIPSPPVASWLLGHVKFLMRPDL